MKMGFGYVVALAFAWAGTWAAGAGPEPAPEPDGFKVIAFENEATYKAAAVFKPVEKNQQLPFGTTVKTGLRSTLDLELSPENQFRVMPRATLTITRDTKDPRLKVLKLDQGTVEIRLDKLPAGHKLQVETPTAVCGALGTRFVVSFEDDPAAADVSAQKNTRATAISCEKGQIYAGSHFTIKDTVTDAKTLNVPVIRGGSALVAVIHEGLENSYTDITVNRGTVSFTFGVAQGGTLTATAEANQPAHFVCALEKSDQPVAGAAVEVKAGNVHCLAGKDAEGTELPAAAGAVLIHKGGILQADAKAKPDDSEIAKYLAAAQTEGELHSKVTGTRLAGGTVPAADEDTLKQAAAAATKLRQELFTDRVIKMLQQIRRASLKLPKTPSTPKRMP